jgi:hypothetical protein
MVSAFPEGRTVPSLKGEVIGFGNAKHANNRFSNFQQHHIQDVGAEKQQRFEHLRRLLTTFSWLMENNPNMIDSLSHAAARHLAQFSSTKVGQMVRGEAKDVPSPG